MKVKQITFLRSDRSGNTMVVALLMLTVISLVGANVLLTLNTRHNYTQKAVGWEESLSAAEAGVDYGFANCRWTLTSGTSSPSAWSGWKKYNSGSSSWVAVADTADANTELSNHNTIIYDLPSGSHLTGTGEGTTDTWYHVEVDAPASFLIGGNQWYRIRSTGYAALPGLARAGSDNPDGAKTHNDILRKLDLRFDHFISRYGDYAHAVGTLVAVSPQATRRVEVIVQPKTPFSLAILAAAPTGTPLTVPLVDSFNSTDTVNYPGGTYNSTSRNASTGIGTNATVYVNAPISSLGGSFYGNVQTNGGSVVKTSNITGTVANNVTITPPPVTIPSWAVTAMSAAPSSLSAGTTTAPLYATYSSINNLTVNLPSGQTKGTANIYVTGNVGGSITVASGVTLKLWFAGNFSMKAKAITNSSNNAANLQFYGIDPTAGQTRSFDIGSGNPGYRYFTLDAPGYDFTVNGNPDFVGAFVVKTLSGNGNTSWHYDEALGTVGQVVDYKRTSWVEDER